MDSILSHGFRKGKKMEEHIQSKCMEGEDGLPCGTESLGRDGERQQAQRENEEPSRCVQE